MSNDRDEAIKARRAALGKIGLAVGALYVAPVMVGLSTAQADDYSRPSRKSRYSRPSRKSRYSRPSRPSRYPRYGRAYRKVSRPSRISASVFIRL